MFEKVKKYGIHTIWLLILFVYLATIVFINFSGNPVYYVTDMYSDMTYAMEVWKHKSIFPEGWVFGNQLYVVATPVLSALFYGLLRNPCLAMGMASTVMTFGILFSFNYMLKPVFQTFRERLMSMAAFMTFVLAFNDAIFSFSGWQLLFTLCSYYACYAITAFLAFGCYLRGDHAWSPNFIGALILSCVLSFGTGMQSLRQTLIMVCPMLAMEMLKFLHCLVRKRKFNHKSWLVTALITASNLAGVLCVKVLDVPQVEIFGNTSISPLSSVFSNFGGSLSTILSLIPAQNNLMVLIDGVLLLSVFLYALYKLYITKNGKAITCFFLFAMSLAAVLFVDIFTTMPVRNIYYFLLYPLLAYAVVCLYSYAGKAIRYLSVAVLVLFFALGCEKQLLPVYSLPSSAAYEEVADYLEEQNITTVFSGWNNGEKIAIASDWNIHAGFWDSADQPFVRVNYLCDPAVFDVDPAHSAYIFFNEAEAGIAEEKANEMNADFTLHKYFEDSGIYVYTSTQALMYTENP